MQKNSIQWLVPVLLAAGAAAALWYYWMQIDQAPPEIVVEPGPLPQIEEKAGPAHPLAGIDAETERPALRPLPPLDESDEYFRLELTDLYSEAISELLVESRLIERVVATVDNLTRPQVAERIRPVGRLGSQFSVSGDAAGDSFIVSSDNYRRYDALVELVTSADLDQLVDMYRRFYPLFQSAYVGLGYPDGYFNDRLIEVIDHLLETPEAAQPVLLVRPHVLYEFADQDLENRSSGQKLLLRMGNEHAGRIKQVLRELRGRIAD